MNEFELNLSTINHTDINIPKEQKEILLLLKYHFLRKYKLNTRINNLNESEKDYLIRIKKEYQNHAPFDNDDFNLPISLDDQYKYYYHTLTKKTYNLYEKVEVNYKYDFFGIFFLFVFSNTDDNFKNDFLNFHLKNNFHKNPQELKENAYSWLDKFSNFNVNHYLKSIGCTEEKYLLLFDHKEAKLLENFIQKWYKEVSFKTDSGIKDKYKKFVIALSNEPKQINVGNIFPDNYSPFIMLYEEHWNMDEKINWTLTDWYLYEFLKFIIKKFNFGVKEKSLFDFIILKFKYKGKKFDRKNLITTVPNSKKINKYSEFTQILNNTFNKI